MNLIDDSKRGSKIFKQSSTRVRLITSERTLHYGCDLLSEASLLSGMNDNAASRYMSEATVYHCKH